MSDSDRFEEFRTELTAHAYRMLGDIQRAQDMVQDAWLRWSSRRVTVDNPRAYLFKTITRLCLNELGSARVRREYARSDSLPEPIDLSAGPLDQVDIVEEISMAFMVVLQRLTVSERAVLLLHSVFDYSHKEVSDLIGKTPVACRKLLSRAREEVRKQERNFSTSTDEHERLLAEFAAASASGDTQRLTALLTTDVELIVDAGPSGKRFGGARNLPGPLVGRTQVVAFTCAVTPSEAGDLNITTRELNGQPALIIRRSGSIFAAICIAAKGTQIAKLFIQADPEKLASLV